jgi:hypothetical protein
MSYEEAPEIPEIINVKFIKEYLNFISNDLNGDDERQHGCQDAIYHAVVNSIAQEKCENPIECCKEVMKVQDIEFSRWCA